MANFCPSCGAAMQPEERFCRYCGASAQNTQQPAQNPYPYQNNPYQNNPYQNPPYQNNPYQNNPYQNPQPYGNNLSTAQEMPMKWFKFIIYFQLFANCFFNLVTGILYLNGTIYITQGLTEKQVELAYELLPDFQSLDQFYGIAMIIIGIFAIIVRQFLAKYKKNGPTFYYVFLAVNMILPIVYMVALSSIMQELDAGSNLFDASSMGSSVAVSIAMLVANIGYFNKRKHLFQNN